MAGDCGVVGGFDRGDCRLSGFYTFQEIALMIFGAIQLYLVSFLGNLNKPFNIRGIIMSPIDPYLTLRSNPLCPALNIVMTAGDNHGDVLRIFEVNSILRTGVPNGVFGGE